MRFDPDEEDIDDSTESANLADIIGRPHRQHGGRPEWRVAEFEVTTYGHLVISEACDNWFSIELSGAEIDRLLDWIITATGRTGRKIASRTD
jgi:hypothetical protein